MEPNLPQEPFLEVDLGGPHDARKTRHGCVTAWLVLMIVANSLTAVVNLASEEAIRKTLPDMPSWALPVLASCAALNVVFAIALFAWKKWGFYGFVGTSIVALIVNLRSGVGIIPALFGLLGVVILYAVLQIGGARKAWPQLE